METRTETIKTIAVRTVAASVRRAVLMLLLTAMTFVTAQAENTLVSHIDYCEGGITCVSIGGWVYDRYLHNWEAGREIEVFAIVSTLPEDVSGSEYEQTISPDVEYLVRADVNSAYSLSGKHGFRMMIDLSSYIDWFQDDEGTISEQTLYVRVYATANNGGGDEDFLLSGPTAVTVQPWGWQPKPPSKIIRTLVGGYSQFLGFRPTQNHRYSPIVDGNNSTPVRTCGSIEIEFMVDEPIIPLRYNFLTRGTDFNPHNWVLKAKAHTEDEWTVLSSMDMDTYLQNHASDNQIQCYCNNEVYRSYRYFYFKAKTKSFTNSLTIYEFFFDSGYRCNHLLPRVATCSEMGIMRECFQRSNDGQYLADDTGMTMYNASDVEIPKTPHEGIPVGETGYWQCWMCHNYFSDEACTTPLPTWSVTLPEHTELISESFEADGNGKYITGTVITFKAEDEYAPYFSNVKNGETELTPDQDGIYTLTVGDANVVVAARISFLELADDADNTATLNSYNGLTAKVTLTGRKLYKNGNWNTLCLPFDVTDGDATDDVTFTGTPLEGATVMELDTIGIHDGHQTGFDATSGTLYLYFKDAESIVAGRPYIVKWDATTPDYIENPVFSSVNVSTAAPAGVTLSDGLYTVSATNSGLHTVEFIGSYSPTALIPGDQSNLFLGTENTLYYPDAANNTEGHYYVNPCRAYLQLPDDIFSSQGDMNGDNKVSIADVTALVNLLQAGTTTTASADINGDNEVNADDVDALVGSILHIGTSAPLTHIVTNIDIEYTGDGSGPARAPRRDDKE